MSGVRLTRRMVLEGAQQVPDGSGGFVETWVALGTLWAEVKAGAGRERRGEGATVSAVRHRVTVRAAPVGSSSRPLPGQRFRDGERVFGIEAVVEGRGAYLVCTAREEVAT